jgi:acetylornithine deacetylase/succinyl-diaminopimelate desuccinylase-like protein
MRTLFLFITAIFIASPLQAANSPQPLDTSEQVARDIFAEIIAIPSTESRVGSTPVAEAIARRLKAAGYPNNDVHVIGPEKRKKNLVARLRGRSGTQAKPILLLAHIDVVEAPVEQWATNPFELVEKDGYFYGRGTSDIKDGAAILAANMIRWKREGWVPERDIIVALTADEEGGPANGVEWLLKTNRPLIDAEYCLNTDGGDFQLRDGKPLLTTFETAEKWYSDWTLETHNPGGHSSIPRIDNAVYQLAAALQKLQALRFPAQLSETSREYFRAQAALHTGQAASDMKAASDGDAQAIERLSEDSFYNSLLRTTCVATMVEAGHARNALPQTAKANVNCRATPQTTVEEIKRAIEQAVGDPGVTVTPAGTWTASPESPLNRQVMAAMEWTVNSIWPGVPVVPFMETGATDGRLLRLAGIPVYAISGVFIDMHDVRAHGRNERIPVKSFYEGLEFYDRFVKTVAGK